MTRPDHARSRIDPAATPIVLGVEIPAVWIGLLAHGHRTGGNDGLGRPVAPGRSDRADDPRVFGDGDIRDLPALPEVAVDGLVPSMHLAASDGRYALDVCVWPDTDTPGEDLLDGRGTADDLVGGRTYTLDDGRTVRVDVRVVWPAPNLRAVAIDVVKRLYGVSKPVAARVVDEARFDLIDIRDPSPAEAVGSVAVGHQDPAVVAALAVDYGTDRTVAEVPAGGGRPRRCVVSDLGGGSRRVVLAGGDWTAVEVDGEPVGTGLPRSGGPNPVTAAKRIARLL